MSKGIDVRQTTGNLSIRTLLLDSGGALVTSGNCDLRLYEVQETGGLKSYDYTESGFKYATLTTENSGLTHAKGNNNSRNTGLWLGVLGALSGFTSGNIYIAEVEHSSASPSVQAREFQFGDAEGDGLNAYADAYLKRDWTTITSEASRSVLNALRFLRNKWSISGSTLTVTKEDDSSTAWTSILTTASSGDPVTGSDPN
jgi:hypothetical protein